jgi:hypothetical protein
MMHVAMNYFCFTFDKKLKKIVLKMIKIEIIFLILLRIESEKINKNN